MKWLSASQWHAFSAMAAIWSAIMALPAEAECARWNISGTAVQIEQSAGGYAVFDLTLDGENVSGTARTGRSHGNAAHFLGLLVKGEDYSAAQGSVDGVYSDAKLELQVRWSDGKTGIYDIAIDPQGRLSGLTYDFNRPSSRANIIGAQRLSCAVAATAPEPTRRPSASTDQASSGILRSGTARRLGRGPAAPAPVARRLGKGHPIVDRTGMATAGPPGCKSGYVMRQAGPADRVCVAPASRNRTASENAIAPSRWMAGDFGPKTCKTGFVWREAFSGDVVCVVPGIRALVNMENRLAASRRAQ